MKIAIEAQRIFRTKKHGMDFVALEVIRQLQQIDRHNQYYILVSPGEDRCLQETSNFKIIEIKCPTYPLWEQIALPLALKRLKPDLLHCTSNTAPIFSSVPLLLTLHDIIFLEKRNTANRSFYQNMGWHYRRFVVPRILPTCRKILTVSNFECNRIRESLSLDRSTIDFVHNGFSAHFKPVSNFYAVTRKYIVERDYLFFLGNTDPKKNTSRTLLAYSIYLKHSTHKLPLLIADIKEDIVDVMLEENKIEDIKPYIRFAGYIPNDDLPSVYSGARVFLYTSLRESFGIPILEAMACGTPVITSNTSSMPEVAGRDAMLIDPNNEQQIADFILNIETDSTLHRKQVEYGLHRVKRFSWRNTATEILDIYKTITGNNKL